jgi:hypothetical protein
MSDEVLSVAELERLATTAEGYATAGSHTFWFATVARVCRHALALEAEVARLRGEQAQLRCVFCGHAVSCLDPDAGAKMAGHIMSCPDRLRWLVEAYRHEVHEDDGDA